MNKCLMNKQYTAGMFFSRRRFGWTPETASSEKTAAYENC